MNPQVTPKKPVVNINSLEAESWEKHQPTPVTKETQLDTHSAWEAYLSTPEIPVKQPESTPVIEASFVEVKPIEVVAVSAEKPQISVESLEESFYSSTYENRENAISAGSSKTEEAKSISIDIYTPLEALGKGVFEAGGIITKAYKLATTKDVKAAASEGIKGFWDYFVTGQALKKKDSKQPEKPKEAPLSPRPFASISTEQNNRIKMSTVHINQQLGNNHAYRGVVNQATGEVYAYYQAEAERAQTFAQQAAAKRQSALEEPEGKKTMGIPGMGKNAKKGQGPKLEMSMERQHSSKGQTLTSALG